MPPPNTPEEGLPSVLTSAPISRPEEESETMERPDSQVLPAGANASAEADGEQHIPATVDKPADRPTKPTLDWHALDYPNEVNQTLCCPICHMPLVKPVITRCDHVFCRSCFDEMLEHSNCCPLDRKSFAREIEKGRYPAKDAPRIYHNQLEELLVRCPNRRCPFLKPRSSIQRHYEDECGHTMVACPDPSCARLVARMDRDGAAGECRHSLMDCPECGEPIDADNVDDHYENNCTLAPTDCVHCGVTVLKHRYAAHLLHECDGAIRPCQYHPEGCRHSCRRADLVDHEQGCAFGAVSRLRLLLETKLSEQGTTILQLEQSIREQGLVMIDLASTEALSRSSSNGAISNTAIVSSTPRQVSAPFRRAHAGTVSSRRELAPGHTQASFRRMQPPRNDVHAPESSSLLVDGTGSSGEEPEGMPSSASHDLSPSVDANRHRHHHHRSEHDDDAQAFLLAGLNSCEERVAGLQRRLAEQDARHSLMLVNEVIPLQEQLTELRSAFTGIAMDMRYVIARQKSLLSGSGAGTGTGTGTAGSSVGAHAASVSGRSPTPGPSGHRISDSRARDSESRETAPPTITPPRL
ncbi:hypothetical protein RB595_004484 [Gaeumannomyces hyphopodioides]